MWRYWGYVGVIVVAVLWSQSVGPQILIVMSALVSLYFMFQVPLWCGAETRKHQMCRRNAYGVLMGCSYRQHRWQKLKMVFVPAAWKRLNHGLWTDTKTGLASMGAILGLVSTAAGLVKSFIPA